MFSVVQVGAHKGVFLQLFGLDALQLQPAFPAVVDNRCTAVCRIMKGNARYFGIKGGMIEKEAFRTYPNAAYAFEQMFFSLTA